MGTNRKHYHELLDRAMDQTQEGESFVGRFVNIILKEAMGKTEKVNMYTATIGPVQIGYIHVLQITDNNEGKRYLAGVNTAGRQFITPAETLEAAKFFIVSFFPEGIDSFITWHGESNGQ